MIKTDLANAVAEATGLTKQASEKIVNKIFEGMASALAKGDKVHIAGFGTLEVRQRAASAGRNMTTGELIPVEAHKVPAFKPAKQLKDKLNK